MTNRKWARVATTMFLVVFAVVPRVLAQFETDAKWVPNHANSLVLVNSGKILNSEMATQSLETLVDGLRKTPRNYKSMKTYAVYFEKFARKIDALSVLDVDPDLVALGATISNNFREIGGIGRDAELRKGVRASNAQDSWAG